MVVVAYRRLSFTRGSYCKALSGKILVFWIGGRLWEVVAYARRSHMEIKLRCKRLFTILIIIDTIIIPCSRISIFLLTDCNIASEHRA